MTLGLKFEHVYDYLLSGGSVGPSLEALMV
jgi:hypothetical protein